MPLYYYVCEKDPAHNMEAFAASFEARLPSFACYECGGKMRPQISKTSFQLKGGGWAKDGYTSTSGSKSRTEEN